MQPRTHILTTALRIFHAALVGAAFASGANAVEADGQAYVLRERPVVETAVGPLISASPASYDWDGPVRYRAHPWPHTYGWPGAYGWHDAWLPLHAPGEGSSVIWVAAGSHGYLGGGFATVQPLNDDGWHYGFAISREQGRDWFLGVDYTHSEISPSLTWNGKRTSVHIGVSLSETRFDGVPRATGYRRGELWEDDRSPLRHRRPDVSSDRFTTRGAVIGVDHHLSEKFGFSFSVSGGRTEGKHR